ncbi:hypothetical protein VST7929_02858 [Vibrio stylophorae]|uniref:DUF1722 domain-containing protein n=1 Tax=Vibrio stylophorae TaxID=659351 RepID=A0ABN8DY24_9VIBR|nr:DUF523 and DUF1722 domain-containing protein [Vibrio stylophorae]CAH0535197.1 hypothetical protein VST7929_02858 [Vibrio stylophorae]
MIPVGISACVLGQKVRFDGGHKQSRFAVDELTRHFDFEPICPEVGVGMGVPRPTIRLVNYGDEIRLQGSKDQSLDFTEQMNAFSERAIARLAHLCGYILCSKSPTCGMERVPVYSESGKGHEKVGVGLFAHKLQQTMPWLPIEEDGRLNDPVLRENFISRVYALYDLNQTFANGITAAALFEFHARYKLMLLACDQQGYRALGRMVAQFTLENSDQFFQTYRQAFMDCLAKRSSRKNNTNTLMHIQGYFKRQLDAQEKEELANLIICYRKGDMPLLVPLTLINHYLKKYPNDYLQSQAYLRPYPETLRLRYGL